MLEKCSNCIPSEFLIKVLLSLIREEETKNSFKMITVKKLYKENYQLFSGKICFLALFVFCSSGLLKIVRYL